MLSRLSMWKRKIKILLVIFRCFGSALRPVKIHQSFNKAHLNWHSRLKGGEKVKDGLVKMISKGHCWKKSGGKVIYIRQPTLHELIKAIMSLGICVIRFQTCLSASAFMSQWLSVAVQLFSQQINNQIKALMWKHNHFRELNFLFSLIKHSQAVWLLQRKWGRVRNREALKRSWLKKWHGAQCLIHWILATE